MENSPDIQTFGPGWRVEFRPLEIQLTDFENAAFSLLVVLTTRCMLAMGYNFYLPMSLVEENMKRAQMQNAVNNQKFWVRKQAFMGSSFENRRNLLGVEKSKLTLVPEMSDITPIELTLNEFMNGKPSTLTAIDRAAGREDDSFPGLIPAIYGYLEALGCDSLTIGRLRPYLSLIQNRASGDLPTAAQWMRNFVRSHPEYKGDGKLTSSIADDLMLLCNDIGMGAVQCPELLGDAYIEPICVKDASEKYLLSTIPSSPDVSSDSINDNSKNNNEISESKTNVDVSNEVCCSLNEVSSSMSKTSSALPLSSPSTTSKFNPINMNKFSNSIKECTIPYQPISMCSTRRISCDDSNDKSGEEKGNDTSSESSKPQPWIAHVLIGSGQDPDTYLDSELLQDIK